jgi:hypothetical protein
MATRSNLIATYQSNPTLQNRYTQQEYLDMFGFGAQQTTPTPDPDPTPPSDGIQNIIGQNLNQGGGGGGGIMGLQQTFTPGAQPRSIPAISDISAQNIATYLKDPALQAKYGSSVEYDNFMQSQMPQPNFIQKGITAAQDFFSGIGTPKVRGTLGTRLANQPKIPLPGALMAYSRSPLNPASGQFNPAFEGQLNYLEGQDGFIGRDQQTGGLKYGPESVLSGQNVISGFGSNDYVKQLDKYEKKVTDRYGKIVDKYGEDSEKAINYKFKFVDKVKKEKQKFIDSEIYKAQEEQRKKEEEALLQKQRAAQEAQAIKDAATVASAYDRFSRGDDSAYSSGAAGVQSDGSYNDPFDPGGGEKDGGFIDGTNRRKYDDGGRVYLYNRLK